MQPAVRPRGRTRRLNGLAQIRAIVHDTERPVGLVTALQTCGERAGIAVEHHGHHIARLQVRPALGPWLAVVTCSTARAIVTRVK